MVFAVVLFLPAAAVLLCNPVIALPTCKSPHRQWQLCALIEVGCQILWHYWWMMAISTSAFSNAVENFLNWCQFALISWTVSYLKTAVKLSWLSLVEVVHRKGTGKPFSLMPFKHYNLPSILMSKRKEIVICCWRHWIIDDPHFSLPL